MIELKKFNVHKIVESKEKAKKLISLGFSILKDEENIMGVNEIINEVKEELVNVVEAVKEEVKVVKEVIKKDIKG